MGQPFVGEIRMGGWNFAPNGWAFCNGATVAISQNDVLFNLIGTTYGGDGLNTFNLPNLLGRFPIHQGTDPHGSSYVIGQLSGVEAVTLTTNQMPSHTHLPQADAATGSQSSPGGHYWAGTAANAYAAGGTATPINSLAVGTAGGSQPHDNMPPFLAINFVISLFGIFPSQN